jgi:hypothetical protein
MSCSEPSPGGLPHRRRQLLLAVLVPLGVGAAAACDEKKPRQAPFSICSRSKRCPHPRICVLRPGVTAGRCVDACRSDGDCPEGQRCTGRYRPGATGSTPGKADGGVTEQRYCKRATVPAGGDCSGLLEGCQPDYECRRGRTCTRTCETDDDCGDDHRCQPVRDRRVFGAPNKTLYRVCEKATLRAGAACGPHRHPLCARGYFCRKQKCVKQCSADGDCADGMRCDGVFQARTRVGGRLPPPRHYCRKAAAEGQRCGRTSYRDVGCVEDHVCYRGRCRRRCETHAQCREAEAGRRHRCRRRRRRGQSYRICL